MIRLFLLSMLFMMGSSFSVNAQKPEWVEKHPIIPEYYIGIGLSTKNTSKSNYLKKAKDNALNNLASQIKIDISSEFINNVTSNSGSIKQDIKSQIQTSLKEELEGYELVDTWENKTEYWVYYRLLKSHYLALKQLKLDKATTLSFDFYKKAKNLLKENKIDKALTFYLQALIPIEKYIDEPLKIKSENSDVFLMNEIYFSIQDILSKIKLNPSEKQIEARVGQPLDKPLVINII